jgi:CRP-like cAMP-binding protein/Fe-S-cluster-containing dehydrogenase component
MSETITPPPANPAPSAPDGVKMMDITIDGKTLHVEESTSIFEAARRLNIEIPALCHRPDLGLNPIAVCRACIVTTVSVDKDGKETRGLATACAGSCGMMKKNKEILTQSPEVVEIRKTLLEMLLAEHPRPCKQHQETQNCELELLGEKYGLLKPLRQPKTEHPVYPSIEAVELPADYGVMHSCFLPRMDHPKVDNTNPSIAVDHAACILCDRCVRACNDVAEHDIIGRMGKGSGAQIGFDNNKLMGASGCVNCGWCMVACPTGALVYTGNKRADAFGTVTNATTGILSVQEMEELPFMKAAKVSKNFLRRLEGGVRRVRAKAGDLICQQGQPGHTAYFIESGTANIYVNKEKPANQKRGLLERYLHPSGPKRATPKSSKNRSYAVADGGVNLSDAKPIATVPEKDSISTRLVGEASCRNGQPRSATIRAAEEMVYLEMTRDVLDVLLRSPGFRKEVEATKRGRMIQNYVRTAPLFSKLPPEELKWLEQQAEMVNYAPGQTIFEQGAPSEAFYVVRLGYVQISVNGEIMSYVGRGQYFGEIGLVKNINRVASCKAFDNVEALRISAKCFKELLARQPQLLEELEHSVDGKIKRNQVVTESANPRHIELKQYVKQELFEGQSLLVIDLDLCTRCDECVKACAQSHDGIPRMIRDGQRFSHYLVPTACRSCHDPKCLSGCPVDAIHRTAEGGLAIVIEDTCVGCGFCFGEDHDGNRTGTGCPYGNIFPIPVVRIDAHTNEEIPGRKAAVCDLDHCTAEKQEPSCVYACPHEAAMRVNADEFFGKRLLESE